MPKLQAKGDISRLHKTEMDEYLLEDNVPVLKITKAQPKGGRPKWKQEFVIFSTVMMVRTP